MLHYFCVISMISVEQKGANSLSQAYSIGPNKHIAPAGIIFFKTVKGQSVKMLIRLSYINNCVITVLLCTHHVHSQICTYT